MHQLAMATKITYTFLLGLLILIISRTHASILKPSKEIAFNFTEIIKEYGYGSEQHKVITEDGYILTVFRMVPPENCKGKIRKPPVLIMHGLFVSADCWVVAGPKVGLGYLITDECFDLWLGNFRGTTYSREHTTLNPDEDFEFWDYSYTELGVYDLPAVIDYVLKATGSDKLNYIGFAQGAGSFYVMCSERQQYCDKISLMISIAPASRLINTSSNTFRAVLGFVELFNKPLVQLRKGEIFERGSVIQKTPATLCPYFTGLCDNAKDIAGSILRLRPRFVSDKTISDVYKTYPAGTSVKNIVHVAQLLRSTRFKKFDYGIKNIDIYGKAEVPSYNLEKVSTPVVIFYGLNDGFVDPKDVIWLADQLPNVLEVYPIANNLWTHEDFIYNMFVKELFLPKLKEYLNMYSSV